MGDISIQAAEFREVQEGRITDNRRTYPLAPFLDGQPLHRYVYYKNQYPRLKRINSGVDMLDLPPTFEQTAYCERLIAAHGSMAAARAVQQGSLHTLAFLSGMTRQEIDFSIAQVLTRLLDEMSRPGWMATFAGATDAGKTNTALVLAGLCIRHLENALLATNIDPLQWSEHHLNNRTRFVTSTSDLGDLARNHEGPVFAVLDELSTQANAQTSNYEVNESFYPLVTAKSKLDLRFILIGHREDGYDLAPAIREHSRYFIKQVREIDPVNDDYYRAEFYDGIADGEPVGHSFDLEPVPPVAAEYDPDDLASFELDG